MEIALWDLAGKAAGRSVSGLIGRVRDTVAVYASSVFLEEGPGAEELHDPDELPADLDREGPARAQAHLGRLGLPDEGAGLAQLGHEDGTAVLPHQPGQPLTGTEGERGAPLGEGQCR